MSPSTQYTLANGKDKRPQPGQFRTESDQFAEAEKAGRLAAMMDGNLDSNGQSITHVKRESNHEALQQKIQESRERRAERMGSSTTPVKSEQDLLQEKYHAMEKQMMELQLLMKSQHETPSVTTEKQSTPSMDSLSKEMLKDVIRYDGRRDTELLLQYLGKLDDFFMVVD